MVDVNQTMTDLLGPSWRTTVAGVGAILGGIADIMICYATDTQPHWQADMAAFWTGMVGILSKDKTVSNAGNPVPARKVAPEPPPAEHE